jgi:FtsH-binding integral membrane protein
MGILCESCGNVTDNENAVFCVHCGGRFLKTNQDILKEIYLQMKKSDETTQRFLKNQIKIAYITLIIAIGAFLIAIVAAFVTMLDLTPEQKSVGFVIIIMALLFFGYFIHKYRPQPLDVDQIGD